MGTIFKTFRVLYKGCKRHQRQTKTSMLLHVSGYKVQGIFKTFEDQGTTYEHPIDKLSEYFKPKKDIVYEKQVFHKSKQSTHETIDNYVVRLSKLALTCEFSNIMK